MELRTYLNIIFFRKWILIQSIVIITIISAYYSYSQVPIYKATARLHIDQSGESLFPENSPQLWSDPDRMLQTQIELITSEKVADKVAKILGIKEGGASVLGQIAVTPVRGADIIEISAEDEIPERARDVANIYAEQFIASRKEQGISQLAVAAGQIHAKLEDVKTDQIELGQKIIEDKGGNSRRLEAEWALTNQLFTVLAERYEELRIDQALKKGGAELFSPAKVPGGPINASTEKNTILGVMVGTVFGLGLVFLFEHLDNTVKSPLDIERYMGLATIGQIPSKEFVGKKDKERSLAVLLYPKSSTAEAFRGLRNNLKFINHDRSIKSIIITSSLPSEGKTTTLSNLAVTLAETGNKVIAICCDLRRPTLHKVFDLKNDVGTSNILVGDMSLDEALKDTQVDGLKVLTSGPLPPIPSDLLGSPRLKKLIEDAKERATYVLIDTPPALAVTDATTIAPLVDGVIVICNAGRTNIETAEQLKRVFSNTTARLLGVVLNNIDSVRHYGQYYYYYSYSYGSPYLQRPTGNGDKGIKKLKIKG